MTAQHLADVGYGAATASSSLGQHAPWDYLVVVLVVFLTALAPGIPLLLWWMFREPKFRGSPLMGTAEVLSLRSVGSMAVNSLVPKIMCRIGLRIAVTGSEPYDVKVWKGVLPWMMDSVRPGSTVPVQVDSSNPRNVRIDVSRPSTRVGFFGTTAQGDPANPMRFRINLQPPNVEQAAEQFRQSHGASGGSVHSAAALLASGQRVMGALKSFAPTGTTPRSLGRTASRPELLDAPHYALVIELHFPNLAPMEARTVQPVPPAEVPYLAIGLPLPCAVDPANPQLCVVDWDAITH